MSIPARFFSPLRRNRVQCRLCRHFCLLSPGDRGKCGVRAADQAGRLISLVSDGIAAWHVDPVEKKPLYHYLPGTRTFSFGTMGCNMDCAWCQNDTISRTPTETGVIQATPATPALLVDAALSAKCTSVAFTYTEPTVFFELMEGTANRALQHGLGSIMVSNGYQSPACLDALRPCIQAVNVDLKSFRDTTYQKYCGARLQPVLDNLIRMRAMGWWLEVTTLIVPGINDDPAELGDLTQFIRTELGAGTPWHISAFHPCRHMLDRPRTPLASLLAAAEKGEKQGLEFIYTGNVPPSHDRPTVCPQCGMLLVNRRGFQAEMAPGFQGSCPHCERRIPGIWF